MSSSDHPMGGGVPTGDLGDDEVIDTTEADAVAFGEGASVSPGYAAGLDLGELTFTPGGGSAEPRQDPSDNPDLPHEDVETGELTGVDDHSADPPSVFDAVDGLDGFEDLQEAMPAGDSDSLSGALDEALDAYGDPTDTPAAPSAPEPPPPPEGSRDWSAYEEAEAAESEPFGDLFLDG